MPSVMVTINGKNYRMACDEGQEGHLTELAQTLDGYVNQLKGSFGEIGDQRLTVMAGIMVTDELTELKSRVKSLEEDIEALRAKRDAVMGEKDSVESDLVEKIANAAEKLEKLSERLKRPLTSAS